jgi:predicted nucleic acid-binding protein
LKGAVKARRIVSAILRVFGVAAVDAAVIQEALQLPLSDFEDAVTAAAAQMAGCACIVTRDPKGFRGSPVRSLTPEAVTPVLNKE